MNTNRPVCLITSKMRHEFTAVMNDGSCSSQQIKKMPGC
jgi:hypothetical protein